MEKQSRRERGRPRPHQPDDRSCGPFQSGKSGARTYTGWVRRRIAALLQGLGKATAFGSAAVPGRINPTTGRAPASITQIGRPGIHRLGAAKNGRAPAGRWKSNGVRERGRPRPHQPDDRSYTCFNHANPVPEHSPAGCGQEWPRSCRALEKQRRSGARPSPAASIRPPILRPVFIPEI